MADVLVLSGGPDHAHDFAATGRALADIVQDAGRAAEVVEHPDDAAAALARGGYRALVVNALRWRMGGERYDPWRAEWAYATPEATRQSIAGFVAAGGGLVGNHTAAICFDDWPEWQAVLGGAWNWGRSTHPPQAPVTAVVDRPDSHPVTAGLPHRFSLDDEVYGDLDLDPAIRPLAHATRHDGDEPQPVVWVHRFGEGRVVYDGFGHDVASLRDPVHVRLLRQAVHWVIEGRDA